MYRITVPIVAIWGLMAESKKPGRKRSAEKTSKRGRKPKHTVSVFHPEDRTTETFTIERAPNKVWRIRMNDGSRPTLKEPNSRSGTRDIEVARSLAHQLVRDLKSGHITAPAASGSSTQALVGKFLAMKAASESERDHKARVHSIKVCLSILYKHGVKSVLQFGKGHRTDLLLDLRKRRKKDGARISDATVRRMLQQFSSYLTWLEQNDHIPKNVLNDWDDMPPVNRTSKRAWLEPSWAKAMLDDAFSAPPHHRSPYFCYILAMLLYTGARVNEVLGLLVEDVNFSKNTITIWVAGHRRVKTTGSNRVVAMWPALREYLVPHRRALGRGYKGLLFPSLRIDEATMAAAIDAGDDKAVEQAMWKSLRGSFRNCANRANVPVVVTPYVMRHTYCSTRLQMIEHDSQGRDVPVDKFRIARELGHNGVQLVDEIYAHVQQERFRFAELDYSLAAAVAQDQARDVDEEIFGPATTASD
jgi:integrase